MASAISHTSPQTGGPVRHRFSLAQYHEMIERGIFGENDSIELIRGEIVQKMVIGNPHAATVKGLNRLLSARLSADFLVSIQDPVSINDSETEPDVVILDFRDDLYASARPAAKDVRLLIEVADTSLAYDREIKGPIYAEGGIVEYWIVNLTNATVEVYRDPQPDGRFATVTTARTGETLVPLAVEGLSLSVDDLLVSAKS